jgi:gluconokinase
MSVENEFILAVDIGTSATKAVLFDTDINQVAVARKSYPIHSPHSGWSEQEPFDIFGGVIGAILEITALLPAGGRILGISFSSQLYSILAVDPAGKPLTCSLTWSDTRSAALAHRLNQHPQAQAVNQRTGCPIDAIYPLSKIRWLKENYELPRQAKFVSIKEYIIFKLTGQWVADWSIASATGLFDITNRRWDDTALSLAQITPANLSAELVSPRQILPRWQSEIINQTGLFPDTPLIIGGGDGPLASIGLGAYRSDILAVNVGTSAAARLIISEPNVDPAGRLWTYVADENLWVIGGIVSSGGMVYDWLLKNFFTGLAGSKQSEKEMHQLVNDVINAVPPGAEELMFVPYLGGEQCPDWNPHTRGIFAGLDFRHNRGHFARAVLEGITRSIFRAGEGISDLLGGQFSEIRVTGGLTASPAWLQIAADMFGVPVVVPHSAEGSARGAALLGAMALGVKSSIKDFGDVTANQARVYPRAEAHAYYQKQYQTFKELLVVARSLPTND